MVGVRSGNTGIFFLPYPERFLFQNHKFSPRCWFIKRIFRNKKQ